MYLKKVFRQSFYKDVEISTWFARHMFNSMFQMQNKLKSVDCIIEVHDARIPFSGRNPSFRQMLTAIKPHLLVLNKSDLADESYFKTITKYHKDRGITDVLFTDAKEDNNKGIKKILPTVVEMMKTSERYNRDQANEFSLMVIGVPNVGKSSLINKLRNKYMRRKAGTRVGALPGVTKSVMERIQISEEPLIYLLDTPGISSPKLPDLETSLRIGLCAILQDHIVGEELLADYLLYWLNKHNNFSYVEYLGMEEPSDNITEALLNCALNLGRRKQVILNGRTALIPDLQTSAAYFLQGFRKGMFGKCILDDDKF